MALLHALGLGVAIVVLRVLAPEIWSAVEHLALSVITVTGTVVDHLQASVGAMSFPATF